MREEPQDNDRHDTHDMHNAQADDTLDGSFLLYSSESGTDETQDAEMAPTGEEARAVTAVTEAPVPLAWTRQKNSELVAASAEHITQLSADQHPALVYLKRLAPGFPAHHA